LALSALILDFDGLVIDSESAVLQSWQEMFAAHGHELPLAEWLTTIGTREAAWEPMAALDALVGRRLDWDRLEPERRARSQELADELQPLPGVVAALDSATALGLRLGVASSSSRRWVGGHLSRLGLLKRFGVVVTRDDVTRSKPDPEVYLLACETLDVAPRDALGIEDSAFGVQAARAAGLRVVAVPGALTRWMDFSEADEVLASLGAFDLDAYVRHARNR
jgi:HAD superfamily hydrolase (TIGR01509 family)